MIENPAYSYPGIELWSAAAWADRYSPVTVLARWIEEANHPAVRAAARSGRYAGRGDGVYTWKTKSVAYPDVVEGWRERGLEYVSDEMGQVTWIAMIPTGARDQPNQRLLVVLHDGDYSDRDWAMDALEHHRDLLEQAADERVVVLLVAPDGVDESHIVLNIVQELSVRFHLPYATVHLDVEPLVATGLGLDDVPGLRWPDPVVDTVAGVPSLDVTGRWQNHVSHLYENAIADRYASPDVHLQHIIHSEAGKRMAEGMALEHAYADPLDPGLLAHWESIGVRYESHEHEGQQWVSLVPLAAYDPESTGTLPVVLVFQEATFLSPFQAITALSSYHPYVELVAQGELMLVVFAMETPEDNDLAASILDAAADLYPVDRARIYVTGHSHNGHLAMEFARRHPRRIAAAASLGNAYGMPAPEYSHEHVKLDDDRLAQTASFDMPVIDICGYSESDFVFSEVGSPAFDNAVDSWRRRAIAAHLPPLSAEEIAAAKTGPDEVSRRIGVPADRSSIEYRMGSTCWIGDYLTVDGRAWLRLVALEHFPHMVAPQMPGLSWDFLRRFARDLDNGAVIERY